MNYNKIATYMFCNACNNSVTSNWSILQSQIEAEFKVVLTVDDIYKIGNALLENFKNAVLDLTVYKNDFGYVFDFVLGTDYCLEM
jgi:hypothetical protein